MKLYCHTDFETFGTVDLTKIGTHIYATHPKSGINCVAFSNPFNGNNISLLPREGLSCVKGDKYFEISRTLYDLASNPDVIFVAHNALFEQTFWTHHMVPLGYPEIPLSRWKCTMAKAYAHGLPGSLGGAASALNMSMNKDQAGYQIMMKLCKPKNKDEEFYTYDDCPEDFEKLYAYCIQDVRVEMALDHNLRDLTELEQIVWEIDQRINKEGLRIDLPLVLKAMEMNMAYKADKLREFEDCTLFAIGSPSRRAKMLDWLHERGVDVLNTKKSTFDQLDETKLATNVKRAIKIANELNKSSNAKYGAMASRSKDGIIRGLYQYHGAHTGRWTSYGIQIHNLPRPKVDSDTVCDVIGNFGYESILWLYPDINTALSSGLRGMIIPREGNRFFCGDFAQMEARVLAFLANDNEVLKLFRNKVDTYCTAASKIFNRPIDKNEDKDERQVGKVSELALGYQGGIGAYAKMAEGYGIDLTPIYSILMPTATANELESAEIHYQLYLKKHKEDKVETPPVSHEVGLVSDIIKQRWRANRPITVEYWNELQRTAIEAVENPGKYVECGTGGWFMHYQFLMRKMASGRCMAYPYPKIDVKKNGAKTLSYKRVDPVTKKWVRHTTYGGQLAENETQALQRDLLSEAMVRLEPIYPTAMHTHDEILSEVKIGTGSLDHFRSIMAHPTAWSGSYDTGIPIDVDVWESAIRYRK